MTRVVWAKLSVSVAPLGRAGVIRHQGRGGVVLERRITLGATTVLHARPVAEIVRLAREFGGDVRLHAPGQEAVDAASILAMMTLVMGPGATVMVTATGAGAEEVLAAIERVLSEG